MRTVAAREIKRRGIGAFDEMLEEGPIYIIQSDRPKYVLLTAEQFEEFVEDQHEAQVARIKASDEELRSGHARRVTAQEEIILSDIGAHDEVYR